VGKVPLHVVLEQANKRNPSQSRKKITFESSPYYKDIKSKKSVAEPTGILTINVTHSKGELSLLKHVINVNDWKESTVIGKGHIFWFGNSLTETDKQLMNN